MCCFVAGVDVGVSAVVGAAMLVT